MAARDLDGGRFDRDLAGLRADPELAQTFLAESLDHLSSVEKSILTLEQAPDDQHTLNEVFRPFHTIKAAAGALGITTIEQVAHHVEDCLMATSASRGAAAGPRGSAEAGRPPREVADEPLLDLRALATVKVDTRKLDTLVDLVGELAIVQSMLHEDSQLVGLKNERLERNLAHLSRITTDLQRGSISVRLVPIRHTFQRMGRLVRDLSHKSGKPLELVASGEETEIDRKVVEDITDPLMHMIRNSVDHGIEDADTRRRAGKPAAGRLSLAACHEGGSVVITVADDGGGLDTVGIHERAVAQKLVEPDAPLSEAEVHALIFQPGFTTACEVTEMSGRGIGMDVVRRNVEALRGRIEIRNRRGAGATFVIKLPLTLATLEGLIVGVADERFVLPTFSIRESLRPSADQIHLVPGRGRIIQLRDEVIPFARLADLFAIGGAVEESSSGVVVVIDDDFHQLALLVDALVGKQEIVIKSLGEALVKVAGVAGGAILGDGRVGLILDAGELIRFERNMSTRAA